MRVFFSEIDYDTYRRLLLDQARRWRVQIWSYCLMPNHVHLVAVPADRCGLARALAETHRRYAQQTNSCNGWRGHLWQERFWSFPMDDVSLRAVTRYVLLNPVRAGLVARAEDWPFSSAGAHLCARRDLLVEGTELDSRIGDWRRLLDEAEEECALAMLRKHSTTGRPMGDESYLSQLEKLLGRRLRAGRPGRRLKRD